MVFHKLYQRKYRCWAELEGEIEKLPGQREKGDAFEQFAFAYFTCFQEIYQIKKLYPGREIPDEIKRDYHLEKRDSGVDGFYERQDGGGVAYQVKFRAGGEPPSYEELTSFWAESEHADQRCIFANCYSLPRQAYKKKDQFTILRDSLTALDEDFFAWLYAFAGLGRRTAPKERLSPRPHQQKMLREVLEGFSQASRGKLLAACGTGKTLTALWIQEALEAGTVLFIAPNLALIKQTVEAWMPQAKTPFSYLCVCSDPTVAGQEPEEDALEERFAINVPVTTEGEQIRRFLSYPSRRSKVIFATYQSLDAIVAALQELPDFWFDIAFFDEAHRTAGNKDSQMFIIGMEDRFIPCRKRLFMTATERFVNPHIVGRARQLNYEVFSMDNREQYGETFTALPFREAIEQGIISDYRIVLCCMSEGELATIIRENQIISTGDRRIDAQALFRQVLLAKVMGDIGIHKVISYHRNIENARQFIQPGEGAPLADVIAGLNDGMERADVYAGHINGRMNTGERKEIFDAFIQSPYGVLSNARCLTEGVDVPVIDGVYFAEPKNSVVDIIQAVGRSLRKDSSQPDKISYIIVPMVISDKVTKLEDIDPKDFATLHGVIQALRDQDRILADFIDKLNLRAAKGQGHIVRDPDCPILVELSQQLDMDAFAEGLSLRIAQVNQDPSRIDQQFIVKKADRTSGVKRTFRTIGDYNLDAYFHNLVLPTLKKYDAPSRGLPRTALAINHNNVSHTVKAGAIEERDLKFYITDVGRAMLEYPDRYLGIFQEQMLKYYERDPIVGTPRFPYRMALRVLSALGQLTRFELAYSLYTGRHFGAQGEQEAISRVEYLRETYPNIEVLNRANRQVVLEALNAKFDTTLTFADIWTNGTTVYNQSGYIRNHLLAWEEIFDRNAPKNVIRLLPGGEKGIQAALDRSAEIETCPMDRLRRLYTQYQGY